MSSWDEEWFKSQETLLKKKVKLIKESFSDDFDTMVIPNLSDIFKIMTFMEPEDIKVVFLGQSPYPGSCNITNIPYANGIAFDINKKCKTIPVSLLSITNEFERTHSKLSQKQKKYFIENLYTKQKCFFLNVSLTLDKETKKDHTVFWKEIVISILRFIVLKNNKCIFVLLGKIAWDLEEYIDVNKSSRIIKIYHPASRDKEKNFFKSDAFLRIDEKMLTMLGHESPSIDYLF